MGEAQRRWYLDHKEISDARSREWQARNKNKYLAAQRKAKKLRRLTWTPEQREAVALVQYSNNIKRKYGMTTADYERILAQQGGHCALCPREPDREHHKRLNWDHDPKTGQVRGLLCTPCNHALGVLGDSPEGLKRALTYVSTPR